MKISVITACFNSKKTLSSALDSVLAQDYNNIEHIIIDNQSTDGTIDLIKNYESKYKDRNINLIFKSERDKGVYDAMNKGLAIASGEVVGFLNADDFFNKNNILSTIARAFQENPIDILYANVIYINKKEKPIRLLKGKKTSPCAFRLGFHPAHPSFYAKREIYKKFGNFDLSYKIAADYEIMLRMLIKHELKSLYIDEVFVKMRTGGLSNASLKNIFLANIESARAWRANNLSQMPLFIVFKPFSKLFGINLKNVLN